MTDDETRRFREFLDQEVRTRHYATLLLIRAEATGQDTVAPSASGNAYNVTFGPRTIIIEHHYLKRWKPVHIDRDAFIVALQQRLDDLP